MHQTSRRQEKRDTYAEVFDNLILRRKVWVPIGMVPDFLSCLLADTSINSIIIHSKYFSVSDWLKLHA